LINNFIHYRNRRVHRGRAAKRIQQIMMECTPESGRWAVATLRVLCDRKCHLFYFGLKAGGLERLYCKRPIQCLSFTKKIYLPPPHRECVRGEDSLAGWRGVWGVNILEDARHCSVLYILRGRGSHISCFCFQFVALLRGHQPAGQRGAQVHPQDCQHGLRRPLHRRDVPQVDRLRALQILLQCLDLPRLCHRLCKHLFLFNFLVNPARAELSLVSHHV
jgi:hypothetical protein